MGISNEPARRKAYIPLWGLWALLWLLLGVSAAWAQQKTGQKSDVIIKRTGDKIECEVRQISQTDILYGTKDMPATVNRSIPLSEVAAILYHDGKVQTFESPAASPNAPPAPVPVQSPPASVQVTPAPPVQGAVLPENLYELGYSDAQRYYTRYGGAVAGTVVTTIFSPVGGLIPAIACSSTIPADERLDVPLSSYSTDANYMLGYRTSAKKIKSKKVWKGYRTVVIVEGAIVVVGAIVILATFGRGY